MKTTEITKIIEQNAREIITNIDVESINLYTLLKSEFEETNVFENYKFQSAFRSFYGLDNVGFNEDFKIKYFKLLENYRKDTLIDIEKVFKDLNMIKNFKNKDSIIFSFASKILSTIDDSLPIYDKEICDVFSFTEPIGVDFDMMIDILMNQFEIMQHHFNEIISGNLLPVTIRLFDKKFNRNNLPVVKKLDFIFWSFGKLKVLENHIDQIKILN